MVNTLTNINEELSDLYICLELNERELSRWSNFIDGDGDLAKHQTFLTAIEKQSKLKEGIKELNQRVQQLQKEKEEIIQLIDKFTGLDQTILKKKYIEGLTLDAIASELGYSYQYVKNKHAELMRMIKFSQKV